MKLCGISIRQALSVEHVLQLPVALSGLLCAAVSSCADNAFISRSAVTPPFLCSANNAAERRGRTQR